MNIAILASIGAKNLGDELIVKNEVRLLEAEFTQAQLPPCFGHLPLRRMLFSSPSSRGRKPSTTFRGSCSFRIFTYDIAHPFFVQENIKYLEYFPIDSKNIKMLGKNFKNLLHFFGTLFWADIVVIGGGGIMYDSELQSVRNPLDQWVFRANCARFFRKKLYFYALGIDIKQEKSFVKLKKIFRKAWKITVRDQKSWEQLKKIGIESEIVDDPVMHERPHPNPLLKGEGMNCNLQPHLLLEEKNCDEVLCGKELGGGFVGGNILGTHLSRSFLLKDFEKYDFSGKKIGLALRSGYIGKSQDARIEKLLVAELCSYIESQGGAIVFLPHSFHTTDIQANDYEFMKQFLTPSRKICENMQEVYEMYQKHEVDVILSMRLHSIILSYVYDIPQIVLSYSQKTEELLKKIN